MDGVLDSYQLGAGLWGGQAWGIVPAAYDEIWRRSGCSDSWEKEDGLFKLNFPKFKKPMMTKVTRSCGNLLDKVRPHRMIIQLDGFYIL